MNQIVCVVFFIAISSAYLDIPLEVERKGEMVAYKVPIQIDTIPYSLAISAQNREQYFLKPTEKTTQKKWKKIKKDNKDMIGIVEASSLEGYTFQGWKRFFFEAFFFIQQKYTHNLEINFNSIKQKQKQTEALGDGMISFGPSLQDNQIYHRLKESSDYVTRDIVSIYRGVNDKHVYMQLGGYQDNFAFGHRNGILFYEFPLSAEDDKWKMSIKSMNYVREKGGRQDLFLIPNSQCNVSISFESQFLILPESIKDDFERNVESNDYSCRIFQDNRLGCYNITPIDLSLSLIQFKIDDMVYINISMYDIRDSYDQSTKLTMFFLKFVEDNDKFQIGQALLKNYYVSIDMKNKRFYYSPTNRYPSSFSGVYVVRFLVGFGIFTVVVAIFALIWQTFNDPQRKNRITFNHEGIRLVPEYQRAGYQEDD